MMQYLPFSHKFDGSRHPFELHVYEFPDGVTLLLLTCIIQRDV